jgi:hypothetical protein
LFKVYLCAVKPFWYILDENKKPVPAEDPRQASRLLLNVEERRVASDDLKVAGVNLSISTVFTAMDYNTTPKGTPILFETKILHGDMYDEIARYHSWQEAEQGHKKFVECLKNEMWVNKVLKDAGINPSDKEMVAQAINFALQEQI